jgi:hypothetical protein
VALLLACSTAQAQTATIFGQDDDVDFLFTVVDGVLVPKTSGAFAEGDILVSIFELPTLTVAGSDFIPAGSEATGIAVIQIDTITAGLPSGIGTVIDFQPYTGGFNAISPIDVADGDATEGAMIAIWLDSSPDLDVEFGTATGTPTNCLNFADCLARATDGSLLQVDGFAGDLDQFWSAVITAAGGNDVGVVDDVSGSLGVAQFNAALTTFENNIPFSGAPIFFQDVITGNPCPAGTSGLDGCIQGPTLTGPVLGGAGLNAGIAADGAFARSDIDASKLTVVPEPGTLMLMGIGLLGLAATLRRRR